MGALPETFIGIFETLVPVTSSSAVDKYLSFVPINGANMNKTSRTDEPYDGACEGFNQSPHPLSSDLTTNQDLNGIANKRVMNEGSHDISILDSALDGDTQFNPDTETGPRNGVGSG